MTLASVPQNPPVEMELRGGTGLEAWARNARLALEVAKSLALTPFVPQSLVVREINARTGKPDGPIDHEATVGNVLGALLTGDELSLQPMAALRSIDIIKGTPALRAITMRALVQAAGHELVVEDANATRAVVKGKRRGSTEWQKSTWDIDRARKLGLMNREQWSKQPTAMLVARATAECARLIAADVLLGLPYSVEEIDDGMESVEASSSGSEGAPARRERTARRRGTTAAEAVPKPAAPGDSDDGPEPDFDETPSPASPTPAPPSGAAEGAPPSPKAAPDPELATKAQLQKLHIVLGENDLADRDKGLAFIAGEIGRPVASSKELTKGEATQLIDSLERRAARQTAPAEPSFDEVPLPNEPPPDEG